MAMHERIKVRVVSRVEETPAIMSLVLQSADGSALPPFTAGAHVDVVTPAGAVRQYSLCGDPAHPERYTIGVLNEPNSRGGSRAMWEQIATGDILSIGYPRNHFPLESSSAPTLLIAGGIGITPLLAMAFTLHRARADFHLHYWTRSAASCAFRAQLQQAPFASRVTLHHDADYSDTSGLADAVRAALTPVIGEGYVYVCGPSGFIANALALADELGWKAENVRREHFSAQSTEIVGRKQDQPFEVVVASTGQAYVVQPGQSIASVLIASGVDVLVSCEQGICGTCVTGVVEGEPDHRDEYLTQEDRKRGDCMLVCCSRAHGARIVLDL